GELVARNVQSGRLRFTASYDEAIPDAEFVFIAVGTPMDGSGQADLNEIRTAAASLADHLSGRTVIVNKSTVPIGTGDIVAEIVGNSLHRRDVDFAVVSNPEFLREGSAVHDFMEPDRIVLGAHDHDAAMEVAALYKPLNAPVLVTTLYAAEMIKYASNAFLATKISFINEIARVCEKLDADVRVVAEGMGMDSRIGPAFLEAGTGYGGSCFPKDVLALARMLEHIGAHPQLLHAVMDVNSAQPGLLIEKVHDVLGTLRHQTIGLLGLSFKANTDDMREAPSLALVAALERRGAIIRAYDPAAMAIAQPLMPRVAMEADAYATADGADALIVVTDWNEFRQLDLGRIKESMRRPVIIDGRNLYDPDQLRAQGFVYKGVGR
ncbi:MAG: UDP-glucose dehydrogenase family protein, partial [Candidatus Dormibacteria bacterium]